MSHMTEEDGRHTPDAVRGRRIGQSPCAGALRAKAPFAGCTVLLDNPLTGRDAPQLVATSGNYRRRMVACGATTLLLIAAPPDLPVQTLDPGVIRGAAVDVTGRPVENADVPR